MRRSWGSERFLVVYSGVLTVVLVVTVLCGFCILSNTRLKFMEIDVQRLNLVEPDGTVRMIISNRSQAPGIIIKGKEYPHPNRKTAGMTFYNDEGTENGGLIFGGEKSKDGKETSFGHLSFDGYEQDQVFALDAQQDGGTRSVGLSFIDRPEYSIRELMTLLEQTKYLPSAQRDAEMDKFLRTKGTPRRRFSVYRTDNGVVELNMKDGQGRDRLVLEVGKDGAPALRLLDDQGKVIGQLPTAK